MSSSTLLTCNVIEMPRIYVPYDTVIHKKIHTEFMTAIPKGERCIIWIDHANKYHVMHLNGSNVIKTTTHTYTQNQHVVNNVALYGILLTISNKQFVCITDAIYYNNKSQMESLATDRIAYIHHLTRSGLFHTNNVSKSNPVFSVAIISLNFKELVTEASSLPYPIEYIRFSCKNRSSYLKYFRPKNTLASNGNTNTSRIPNNTSRTFRVKAEIAPDTYTLYHPNSHSNDGLTQNNVACIQTYEKSVWMNSLFRTIRENTNLDLLEESDDESDFENTSEYKHISNTSGILMKCTFNDRFKKWMPIEVVH